MILDSNKVSVIDSFHALNACLFVHHPLLIRSGIVVVAWQCRVTAMAWPFSWDTKPTALRRLFYI